jgi:hypothetical protein
MIASRFLSASAVIVTSGFTPIEPGMSEESVTYRRS